MKIRNGFVSNSSSSSFILQTELSKDELMRQIVKIICGLNKYNLNHVDCKKQEEFLLKRYSEENIRRNVQVLDSLEQDSFLFEWWQNIDLSNKTIVYITENYLYDVDQFWPCLTMLENTELVNYCGHMG